MENMMNLLSAIEGKGAFKGRHVISLDSDEGGSFCGGWMMFAFGRMFCAIVDLSACQHVRSCLAQAR